MNSIPSTVSEFTLVKDDLDLAAALDMYQRYGIVVIRGLMSAHVAPILQDIEQLRQQAVSLLPQAIRSDTHTNAWLTPDGSLFNEDPRQPGNRVINSLRVNALTSGSFTNALLDSQLLDIVEQMLGHNIELWKWGQCVYKQPHTGVPKSLHQDGYYFEHRHQSPIAVLTYAINVDQTNGPLFVVPGSHQLGLVEHADDRWAGFALTDPSWWERAVAIEGEAGDAILFHANTIHGSPENRSDRPRPVFIQRYRRADDFCMIDVGNVADRRAAERAPHTKKVDSDWGLMVRGIRRYTPQDHADR